jgi:hypothetical protein
MYLQLWPFCLCEGNQSNSLLIQYMWDQAGTTGLLDTLGYETDSTYTMQVSTGNLVVTACILGLYV